MFQHSARTWTRNGNGQQSGNRCNPRPSTGEFWASLGGTPVTRPDLGSAPKRVLSARRLSGEPYTLPEEAVEWVEALAALRREALTNPRVAPFREQIARACERTAKALRADPFKAEGHGRPV